ncbi:MAG TPA: flavin reductase family protein [Acidimicrobiales bacterium]|nr:flavin reductase family protein [Acidimicrobiales bacterium]
MADDDPGSLDELFPLGDGVEAVGQAEFRTVLGHFASGVVVVTGRGRQRPVGFTCQSFFSLSLVPPLVAFAPSRTSTSWPQIQASGACTANVLTERQEALARAFARSSPDKFVGVGWESGVTGAPRLHDALAWIDCRVEHVLEGGDHLLVVAAVAAVESNGGEPLVFYRGGFGTFRS